VCDCHLPLQTTDFGGCKFSANGKDDVAKTGNDIVLVQEKLTDDITINLMDGKTVVNSAVLKGTQKRGADAVFDYAQADKGNNKLSFTLTVTGNKENAPFLRLTCDAAAASSAFSVSNKDFATVSISAVDSRAVSLLNKLVDKTNTDDFGGRVIKLADAKGSNTVFPKPVASDSSSGAAAPPPHLL
jgi:hypothetical protein